jgi:hypothetical protein
VNGRQQLLIKNLVHDELVQFGDAPATPVLRPGNMKPLGVAAVEVLLRLNPLD